MRSYLYFLAFFALVAFAAFDMKARGQSATQPGAAAGTCPATLNRALPTDAQSWFGENARIGIWSDRLFTALPADSTGAIVFRPGGPGFILPDGSLGMKFLWLKGPGLRGSLAVEGKRLDASAPPLRSNIPSGYEDTDYQPSSLIFSTTGCWDVTAQVVQTKLTFVTRVVRITEGK